MVKLVPAKCPSCGAKIELDDNMKRAECEYCHNTIVVDDAIAKYKLEISGNVKVSSVKDYSDKLLIVQKHIKAKKFSKAKELLESILEDDEYNLEALKAYVTLLLDYRNEFFPSAGDGNMYWDAAMNEYNYLDVIYDKINMIESTDDDGKYEKFVKNSKEKISALQKEISNKYHDEQIRDLYTECNNYIDLDKSKNERINELQKHFNVDSISVDALSDAVKENEYEEIAYVRDLIENYHNKKESTARKKDDVGGFLTIALTVVISAVGLFCEWSYIIKDIIDSFSNFSILVPLAAVIYIVLGIGLSALIILVSFLVSILISKIITKLFIK